MPIDRRAFLCTVAACAAPRLAGAATLADAGGRSVAIPERVTRVFPSGPPAAILLYTLAPDLLAKSPKPATFDTVSDKKVLTDGNKVIELYHMKDSSHNVANLLVFMPKENLKS